uniref:Mitochondrial import inner membrane translocase subunit Tim21 n=1 Tax=Brassica campestris TaxID=3711 RepID=M4F5W2_BRACM
MFARRFTSAVFKRSSSTSRYPIQTPISLCELVTRFHLTMEFDFSLQLSDSSDKAAKENGTLGSFGRKAVSFVLITVTGGVALSALDDLSIYRGCSSKAMEKVMRNKAMIEAIGEPIEKGPWYNASLAVSQQRHSVSCSFPVVGPQGTGILHLKAVRNGEDSLFGFLQQREWDILIMDALVHVPSNDGPQQTLRIDISDFAPPSAATDYKPSEPEKPEKS